IIAARQRQHADIAGAGLSLQIRHVKHLVPVERNAGRAWIDVGANMNPFADRKVRLRLESRSGENLPGKVAVHDRRVLNRVRLPDQVRPKIDHLAKAIRDLTEYRADEIILSGDQ